MTETKIYDSLSEAEKNGYEVTPSGKVYREPHDIFELIDDSLRGLLGLSISKGFATKDGRGRIKIHEW